MQQTSITLPEIYLVGMSVPTSYTQELDKMNGRIFPLVRKYFHECNLNQIANRKKPGATFCVYTDYTSDYKGKYTYFIGEEVTSLDSPLPEGFQCLTIPKQKYAKFTTSPAPMPDVIVKTWEKIWNLSDEELGGKRRYATDFEIYDERAADHQNIVLDVYVGVNF